MGAKIAALILTVAANLAAAVVLFFFLILAMNGYSEADASWGLGAFALLSVLVALVAGGGAFFVAGRLAARGLSPMSASAVAVAACSALGIALEILCSIIGILVSELVRTQF